MQLGNGLLNGHTIQLHAMASTSRMQTAIYYGIARAVTLALRRAV